MTLVAIRRIGVLCLAAACVCAIETSQTPALAHQPIPGVTGFPALMLHPLLLTHQAIGLTLAALLIGRTKAPNVWMGLGCFAFGLVSGVGMRTAAPFLLQHYWITSLLTLLTAGLVTATLQHPRRVLALPVTGLLAIAIGLDTTGEGASASQTLLATLATFVTSTILILPIGWLLSRPSPRWIDHLARIIAAWLTAATVMVLAFAMRA